MNTSDSYLLVLLLAIGISLVLTPLADVAGRRWRITARFGGRRLSQGDARRVSKLGGLALYGAFTMSVLAAQLLPVPRLDPYEVIRLTGLLFGGTVIFAVGLLDDIFELSPLQQFLGQFAAAAIAIVFQIFIEFVNNPFTGAQTAPWSFLVTVGISFFWLVGMMNTVNWLDGADGLAAGVACIAGVILFANSAFRVNPPQASVSLLHLALVGASLGFLVFNFHPARIIMGGGAPFLGFALGSLSIIGGAKMATILLVMGLPLLDSMWQVFSRLRQGKNPFQGDRGHLHFRLQDMGVSTKVMVVGYYVFCAVFGGLTLVTTSQVFKFIVMSLMAVIAVIGFWFVNRRYYSGAASSSGAVAAPTAPVPSSFATSDEIAEPAPRPFE
ncbi:MAG: undecaprenyl/decaprenyl-phosphate alpha-N-acetylglucosaminyl 1-phosphate transferase [Anaerolineae bacterium]|nr:undecaprenyl/decaprenyl-phosphate alpha-N-acetylglucosaminyl 1-phosphate transferase [Anaerolineae bacterium]NUQ02552.1 undecaprenyl/decaprenyl-phosphate alpha-N-acetylglucosaminyl 1-phosphate transferase [Anaerolineae bacterium]